MTGVARRILQAIGLSAAASVALAAPTTPPPACRMDASASQVVESTLQNAIRAYRSIGKPVPFERVQVNPKATTSDDRTLTAYVLIDASAGAVDKAGCPTRAKPLTPGDELDLLSVRGGCVASATDRLEIRCSSSAVQTFGRAGTREGRANPALLYVLAHEIAHILQRRAGEYAGRVEPIDLKAPQEAKLTLLRESCEPGSTKTEEDADRLALQVLAALLRVPPYREPLFSEQGSVLWGVDQLNLAANVWRKESLEREFISQQKPHTSFIPTDLPTPSAKIQDNAKRFVCDVLTKKTGTVLYPGKATTHPTLEERIRKVAEALKPVAASLPKTTAQQEYRPIAVLQEQLSDIFTFMYRETGVYLEAVQGAICTRVNSDKPAAGC